MNIIELPRTERHPLPPGTEAPADLVLDFGKRKGLAVSWVAEHDLTYALWLMSQRYVRDRAPLWLCLRRHVARVLLQQETEHDAGMLA